MIGLNGMMLGKKLFPGCLNAHIKCRLMGIVRLLVPYITATPTTTSIMCHGIYKIASLEKIKTRDILTKQITMFSNVKEVTCNMFNGVRKAAIFEM